MQGLLGGGAPASSAPKPSDNRRNPEDTLVGRVIQTLIVAGGGPLTPKEIVQELRNQKFRGHDLPNFYSRVFNTIKYLMEKNPPVIERREDGKYALAVASMIGPTVEIS